MRRPVPSTWYLVPLAALIAVFPLILHGCSCGHDFDFHLVSWMEAAAQFKAGNLHPAWAFSPAWNAGEPRFVFYPPISWTLGALLGLLLPWAAVPIVLTWVGLAAAGCAMYAFARSLDAGETASSIAAVVYLVNPYMLFTAYERTAYAELLAAAWIPLLLAAMLRTTVSPVRIAIPVSLLWLTNAPAAVMGCYALAVLAAVRLFWLGFHEQNTARVCFALFLRVTAGLALGMGCAAFYIVPAAYERRWVQIAMATVEGLRIQDNFLFHHTSDALHDEVLHTASWIAVSLLCATLVVLGEAILRNRPTERTVSLGLLALLIGFLLTPASMGFWHIAPEITFLQFPWRLTAILAAVLCGGLALLLPRLTRRPVMAGAFALLLVCALVLPFSRAFTQACDDEDMVAARMAVFVRHLGTDPTDEYTTGEADNDALRHANPPFWLSQDGNDAAPATGEAPGTAPMHFDVTAPRALVLVLNLRDFPAWIVRVNGSATKKRVERADGLIALPIQAGRSVVDISYGMTRDRELGDALSLIALAGTVTLSALSWFRRTSRIIESG